MITSVLKRTSSIRRGGRPSSQTPRNEDNATPPRATRKSRGEAHNSADKGHLNCLCCPVGLGDDRHSLSFRLRDKDGSECSFCAGDLSSSSPRCVGCSSCDDFVVCMDCYGLFFYFPSAKEITAAAEAELGDVVQFVYERYTDRAVPALADGGQRHFRRFSMPTQQLFTLQEIAVQALGYTMWYDVQSFQIIFKQLMDTPILYDDSFVQAVGAQVLLVAAASGRRQIVDLILQDGRIDPSESSNRAIRLAAKHGHTNVCGLLIDDERVDPSGFHNDAIRCASQFGHIRVVRLLLKDERVDPSAHDDFAIGVASRYGHVKVVKELLQDPRVNPSADDNFAIRSAAECGQRTVLDVLMKDERVESEAARIAHLQGSCVGGHVEEVAQLLNENVDPSVDANYAIREACRNGHKGVVQLLLKDERVDPTVEDNECVKEAAENGFSDVVKLLLRHSKSVDPASDENCAMRLAAGNGHLGVVKALMKDSRVDPSAGLFPAVEQGHLDVTECLSKALEKKGSPRVRGNSTLLEMAAANGHDEMVEFLMQH